MRVAVSTIKEATYFAWHGEWLWV